MQWVAMVQSIALRTVTPRARRERKLRAETQEVIVHFINFETRKRVTAFAVVVKKLFPASVNSVTLFTPERDEPVKLEFAEADSVVKFIVPEMGGILHGCSGMRAYASTVVLDSLGSYYDWLWCSDRPR